MRGCLLEVVFNLAYSLTGTEGTRNYDTVSTFHSSTSPASCPFFSQGLVAPILVTLILSIVLGASTFHRLDDEPAESLGAILVKGKREAVSVFRLANA